MRPVFRASPFVMISTALRALAYDANSGRPARRPCARRTRMITPSGLAALFDEEIAARGGKVADFFQDESRLFARSIVHPAKPVARRDDMEGGVAVALLGGDVSVRPYLF